MVVIEAGWGSGAALVGGRTTPDEYRVSTNGAAPLVVHRRTGRQTTMTVWRDGRRSEEHTSELQSRLHLVCRLLLEKKKPNKSNSWSRGQCSPSGSHARGRRSKKR